MDSRGISKSLVLHALLLFLIFCSGVTALIYQVLWMRETGLIFGNSAYAAATTITVFFAGLAAGGYYWGLRVVKYEKVFWLYAALEVLTAVCALVYFLMSDLYAYLYPLLFNLFIPGSGAFLAVKFLLCSLLLFPAAFCMGGTMPVICHAWVQQSKLMAHKVSLIYGVNTLGAGAGVILAGFFLPPLIGVQASYALAIFLNGLIAFLIMLVFGKPEFFAQIDHIQPAKVQSNTMISYPFRVVAGLAFFSGFITLALQIFWNRSLSQVLQNSVYTFAAILIVFLLMLAAGAFLAGQIMKFKIQPKWVIQSLLLLSAIGLLSSNHVFFSLTENLQYFGEKADWLDYISQITRLLLLVIAPSMLVLGVFFPYLLKLIDSQNMMVGEAVGRLIAINTIGGIFGSFIAGFFLLQWLGAWNGIELIALILLAMVLIEQFRQAYTTPFKLVLPLSIAFVISVYAIYVHEMQARGGFDFRQQKILKNWQGKSARVTVTEDIKTKARQIYLNQHYSLGGTSTAALDEVQSIIPLALHENPESVFFLGLGTGITAGAALQFPIKKLVATELVSEVIEAAETYFKDETRGLFTDPRVHVYAEDGRQYLMATHDNYDVIIGDLFLPWKSGTGSLYTLEHFQTVSNRLAENGLFMQWLPSHQISEKEFLLIANTMRQVFPNVTLWRGDFVPRWSVVGLLAMNETQLLQQQMTETWLKRIEFDFRQVPLLAHYMGNLSQVQTLFEGAGLNTDDRPEIEFQAPIDERKRIAGLEPDFSGQQLLAFAERLNRLVPFDKDDALRYLSSKALLLPEAGMILHQAANHKMLGDSKQAGEKFQQYQTLLQTAVK